MTSSDAGDEEVRQAIIVAIADCGSHAVKADVEPGTGSHILKVPFAIVMIQDESWRRLIGWFMPWPEGGIDEQQVLSIVVIEVNKGDAAPHRLGQQLVAVCTIVMHKADASSDGDIFEGNRWNLSLIHI